MCFGEVELSEVAEQFDRKASEFAPELASLQTLSREGLVDVSGTRVKIANGAHAAVRVVCAEFDRYLATAGNRHATAV
jgi:coproporphyrinogen III oxidase-like Fe-S oxidoreductase